MVVFGAALGGLAAFGRRPNWPSDAAGWPKARPSRRSLRRAEQTCEPQSVAPQGEAAAEAPKKTSLPEIGKRRLP
ncbi:hypothetical protein SGRA_2079 [Saprospira grandis str. Lewin]|uniref:Uncharacterized protein n=1 Tax=Saprospira grandis (strain Lewin) TaxID=984262 RepID=H6L2Q3_SAPGL|nr:hypothetical protein SGRA_2079 [Saprospira grandis str. Lewin]